MEGIRSLKACAKRAAVLPSKFAVPAENLLLRVCAKLTMSDAEVSKSFARARSSSGVTLSARIQPPGYRSVFKLRLEGGKVNDYSHGFPSDYL